MSRTHVVVIGGGYAGTLAANRLGVRPDIDVTLINPRPVFVERIRLHQHVAGTGAATADYAELLGAHVTVVVDTAEAIDAAGRRVTLASGATVGYDYLIYTAGSTGPMPPQVPGTAEFAYSLDEFEQAERLRHRLRALPGGATVTVVGGGLTGIEAATELAEAGHRVRLLGGGRIGPSLSEPGRRSVTKALHRLGVSVLDTAVVAQVRPDAVVLADRIVLTSAVTVWTAGFGVAGLAAASGLPTDPLGRLRTDETLTCIADPRIVAAGDAAAPSGAPLRMSCQAALPMGAQAAETVLARIGGTPPAALDQAFVGQCISLGRKRGTIQLSRFDDTPTAMFLGGRLAAAVKETICKTTVRAIRREAARPGTYRWLRGGDRRLADPAPQQGVHA